MDRSLPDLPFERDREPRSAGYPPSRHSRHSDPFQPFPHPGSRYSDPGPSVPGHYRPKLDYTRNYSVASTASSLSSNSSSSSSLFGTSYSISSASSIDEGGYLSPPASRRTSEATREANKLPSIHELDKQIIEMPPAEASPTKRDSITLATIPEEGSGPQQERLAFPPHYPGSTITAIPKGRSNSYPPSNSNSFPPPPFNRTESSPHHYHQHDPQSRPIARVLEYNNMVMRFVKDLESVQEESKHLYHFAGEYKERLTREPSRIPDRLDLPPPEVLNEYLRRVEQIQLRIHNLQTYHESSSPFRPPHSYVKHEEDTRMHDVVPSTRAMFVEPYPPPSHPMYQESSVPPTPEQYWLHGQGEHGRSKYKKRSRAAPPGRCHSCNIESTPEWRRGPDGARTLCNACGLHYAKLAKKTPNQHSSQESPFDLKNGHHEDSRQDSRHLEHN